MGLTLVLMIKLVQADRPAWSPALGEPAKFALIFHSSSEDSLMTERGGFVVIIERGSNPFLGLDLNIYNNHINTSTFIL